MERDGLLEWEAQELIDTMRDMVLIGGEHPDEVLLNYVGLEPDYVEDLLYD
ncbi:MAG: hypothetical protein H8E98_03095 [Bacteroidetes bacterium]|nr:hypothetical protein [Bacteroidota bacterium]